MTFPTDKEIFPDPGPTSPRNNPSLADAVKNLGNFAERLQDILGLDPDLRQGKATVAALFDYLVQAIVPTGAIFAFGGTVPPNGFLICDGSVISRTTYASLFAVISTAYGAGNGSTTFSIPDMKGRFVLGKAASGTGSTMGATGGSLQHTHTVASHSHTAHSHTHDVDPAPFNSDTGNSFLRTSMPTSGGTGKGDTHYHVINVPSTTSTGTTAQDDAGGGGNTGNADPPYVVANYLIKI